MARFLGDGGRGAWLRSEPAATSEWRHARSWSSTTYSRTRVQLPPPPPIPRCARSCCRRRSLGFEHRLTAGALGTTPAASTISPRLARPLSSSARPASLLARLMHPVGRLHTAARRNGVTTRPQTGAAAVNFTPDFVFGGVAFASTNDSVRSALYRGPGHAGDLTGKLGGTQASDADRIQALGAGTVQVGTTAAPSAGLSRTSRLRALTISVILVPLWAS